jgi:hypothetical protein
MNKAMLVRNIENMADFLINKCGFRPEEIQKFPTKDDKIVFHYKGKRCQVKNKRR